MKLKLEIGSFGRNAPNAFGEELEKKGREEVDTLESILSMMKKSKRQS